MLELPDFNKEWDYVNGFFLTCSTQRISKMLAQWELFKMVLDVPGDVVECGVFKGASLARFAAFRQILGPAHGKKLIGFDLFTDFAVPKGQNDKAAIAPFVKEAGSQAISVEQMMQVLEHKNCAENVDLVAGDICETIPKYVEQHPQLIISLLNLDVDLYEPAVTVLEYLFPLIRKGGILLTDSYSFPGETKAVDEYLKAHHSELRVTKLPFCHTPCYVVKE
ncbi:TylF/MycF/NovP-related O-methyltransferase [Chloroflexota bacterium]